MYMPLIDDRTHYSHQRFSHHGILKSTLLLFFCALEITTVHAHPQNPQSEARSQYQTERTNCLNGHSDEDQKTCLKEASAALAEKKHGQLDDVDAQYQKNATLRCQALDSENRDACLRRMQGEGTVSGSVAAGGILRELVTQVPQQPGNSVSDESSNKNDSEHLTPTEGVN
jgi:hypothetical protein